MIPFIDRAAVTELVSPAEAVAALRRSLTDGFRPEDDLERVATPLRHGEFLLMPSEAGPVAGIKVLTLAPGNPDRGHDRIQGIYLLLDSDTLSPRMLIDGPALTNVRTPAVSLAGIHDVLLAGSGPLDVVVYGASHQGVAHVRTLAAVVDGRRELRSVTAVVRRPERVESAAFTQVVASGSAQAQSATASAGLILCTTTAATPLFDGSLVRDDAIVVAVGSHETDKRELDAGLMGRSDVIVEDIGAALRECGDVVMAIADGVLCADDLLPMADVVTGARVPVGGRPVVFKTSGMPWEDLVIAAAVADADADADAQAGSGSAGSAGSAGFGGSAGSAGSAGQAGQ